jgi:ATP-dependent helicase HrpB
VLEILEADEPGDILIFLPGMREIRECQNTLLNICENNKITCLILHGRLDTHEQSKVLEISTERKLILSTNIAESSLTIPGVRIVIDSGLQRESSYNFYSGLPELNTTKISQASADQRSGRANREASGVTFRLYAELDFNQRPYLHKPEIIRSDLSELYLMALFLFNTSLEHLSWLDEPPVSALKNSYDLLQAINAIDSKMNVTYIGKKILNIPLHPRLGRILVEAEKYSLESVNATLSFLADYLEEKNKQQFIKTLSQNMKVIPLARKKSIEEIMLSGFPDRVARARGDKYFDVISQNGETIKISPQIRHDFNPSQSLWIILDLNNRREVSKIMPIEEGWLYDLEPFPIRDEIKYFWDEKNEQVQMLERTMIGKILLTENKIQPKISNQEIRNIIQEKALDYINTIYNTQEYERLLTLNKLAKNISIDKFDLNILNDFLGNKFDFKLADKEYLSSFILNTLKNLIDPENIYDLEKDLPQSIQLTDKRRIAVIYDRTQGPYIESFIQDFYGLSKTPVLAKGKINLTLKLLGPHKRAIQVTQDLASFWKNTYPSMFKELTRDYPRHHWPLNPDQSLPVLLKRQLVK